MQSSPRPDGRHVLREYEWTNLLFFLLVILALGGFVTIVFRAYSTPDEEESSESEESGIVSEVLAERDTCIFSLGTKVSETSRRYRSPMDVTVTDDGLVKELLAISGVVAVVVNQKSIVIHKSPLAGWNDVQARARVIIGNHLHMHQ